jgi:hypothetical protein
VAKRQGEVLRPGNARTGTAARPASVSGDVAVPDDEAPTGNGAARPAGGGAKRPAASGARRPPPRPRKGKGKSGKGGRRR